MPTPLVSGIYKSRAKPGKNAIGRGFPTTTWHYFPIGPRDIRATPMFETRARANGTHQMPKYWDVEFIWPVMLWRWWSYLNILYDVTDQPIRLSYLTFGHGDPTHPKQSELGTDSTTLVNSATSGWVEAPAIFAEPPTKGEGRGLIVPDVSLKFTKVEWFVGGATFNNSFPPGTDAVGATTIHDSQTYFNEDLS